MQDVVREANGVLALGERSARGASLNVNEHAAIAAAAEFKSRCHPAIVRRHWIRPDQ